MSAQSRVLQAISAIAVGPIQFGRLVYPVSTPDAAALAVSQCAIAGTPAMGVAARSAASGSLTDINTAGTTVVESGNAIPVGAEFMSDAQGRAVAVANNGIAAGIALQVATAAGQFIEAKLY